MRHEKRIVKAFNENGIEQVLLIDDGYDPPSLGGLVPGEIMDFLDSADGPATCIEAGLTADDAEAAKEAALNNEADSKDLSRVNAALYKHFVTTRNSRFDPGGRFQTLKGATLDDLAPLVELLAKCRDDVEIRYAGLNDGEEVYLCQKPQVVFLDYYLSPDVPVGGSSQGKIAAAGRKQSIDLLRRLLNAMEDDIPAIVLMSSADMENKAEPFRQEVKARGHNPLALRFRLLQKGWVSIEAGKIKVSNEAADALLDTAQGFIFGQVLQRALTKWREGADKAMNILLQEISGLEPKDFAYLLRFRLVSEGTSMSDYLEWMFGESLRALVDEHVPWGDKEFARLNEPKLSEGIEGAFEGPSTRIAKIFHRIRINERKSRPPKGHALGDIYVDAEGKSVRTVVTPDCDLVVRNGATKVRNMLTMGGELRAFDQDSASADQFVFFNNRPYSLKWNPKDLKTYSVKGESSLKDDPSYEFAGTLRPLYAQDMQRQSLTDLSRVGLAVAPVVGVNARVIAWLRVKKGGGSDFEKIEIEESAVATMLLERADARSGHRVLLRRKYLHSLLDRLHKIDKTTLCDDDGNRLSKFLKEKSEDRIVSGFLTKGSYTNDNGPLGSKFAISRQPDKKQGSPWLQFLLELSEEAMEEVLTIDPSLKAILLL